VVPAPELTASDAATGDLFGGSVALSGSTALIGAPGGNSEAGAAYVFALSGTTWSQQAELTASDAAENDGFGARVALSGSTALIGAPDKNTFTGAAYVFVRSGTAWSQEAELTASGLFFGYSVALSGSIAMVGAYGNNSDTGAAYVFVRSGTSWSQQAELTASDAATGDYFGISVALSGSTALIGAPDKNSLTGAAYVFVLPSQQAELVASDAAADDFFGSSVAISGSIAVVGAYGNNSEAGAAYVFVRSGKTWSQQAELTASDAATGDLFGYSVALSGTTAVVGAFGNKSRTGAAYVFARSGKTWSQQAELTASSAATGDEFGGSVAISGSTALIGAPAKKKDTGAAYVFVRSGTTWSQQAELTASDAAKDDYFGVSVALSGSTAVVGAEGNNTYTGAAYVFVRSGIAWSQQAELTASDAAKADYFGFSVALSGSTALIGAYGAGAAYVFVRSGTNWSQQAELTASDAAENDFFGYSVALSGSTALIGAYGDNSGAGAAYVFVRSGTNWSQQAELTAAESDVFGFSVALSSAKAVIGAPYENSETGAAYAFANV